MRTPNTQCLLCGKPLYRRPGEMENVRYSACRGCRARAQSVVGVTEKQRAGLSLGAQKGRNNRKGYRHAESSKRKTSVANKNWCAAHPELVAVRAAKIQGAKHYRWNGGVSRLNVAVRRLSAHRDWSDKVKARDRVCVRCGDGADLEAHHVVPLVDLLNQNAISTREQARASPELWDVSNGVTLCRACHYTEHGRTGAGAESKIGIVVSLCETCGAAFRRRPSAVARFCSRSCVTGSKGAANPNYKGGLAERRCVHCDSVFSVRPAVVRRGGGRFCGRDCVNDHRRKAA